MQSHGHLTRDLEFTKDIHGPCMIGASESEPIRIRTEIALIAPKPFSDIATVLHALELIFETPAYARSMAASNVPATPVTDTTTGRYR